MKTQRKGSNLRTDIRVALAALRRDPNEIDTRRMSIAEMEELHRKLHGEWKARKRSVTKINTRRVCAGAYEVTSPQRPGRMVSVSKVWYPNDGEYWIAAPDFDRNTSDPLPTKRDATKSAAFILETY